MKKFIAAALALFAVGCLVVHASGCSPPLTPDDHRSIAADGVRIAVCQEHGRECKRSDAGNCFAVYDDCILDSGLREGSAR